MGMGFDPNAWLSNIVMPAEAGIHGNCPDGFRLSASLRPE
jgi:hypothetical protein